MDIKIITKLGWSMMTEETRDDLMSRVIRGNEIDAAALASLINECRDTCYVLTEREVGHITEQQKIQIRWMLTKISGEEVVQKMAPDEIVDFITDLKSGVNYSFFEKMSIVKAVQIKDILRN